MQNVYDIARDLVHSLKESDQYKNYKSAKNTVDLNPQLSSMINDFTQKGMELQTMTMAGQQPDEENLSQYQQLYSVVMSDPAAAAFLNAQMQLSQIVTEIYQMIGEALNE